MTKKSNRRRDREKTQTFVSDKQLEADAWKHLRARFPGESDEQIRERVRAMPVKEREKIIGMMFVNRMLNGNKPS